MARKFSKKILAFAPETSYGVDAIAGGTPHYVLGREVIITPMAGESKALEYDNGKLGNSAEVVTELYTTLEFGCDFSASADPASPAPWSGLLASCLRRIDAGEDEVVYALDDDSIASNTFYFYMDGTLHAIVGARGSMKLSMVAKDFPKLTFSFRGLHVSPKAQALPVANFSAWQTPLKVGAAETSATLDGKAIKMISFEYDQANQVIHQEYVGHEEVMITDYQPTATMVLEAPTLQAFDLFALAEAGSTVALIISHGSAGNQVRFESSAMQIGRPTYAEQEGTLTYSLPLRPIGSEDKVVSG